MSVKLMLLVMLLYYYNVSLVTGAAQLLPMLLCSANSQHSYNIIYRRKAATDNNCFEKLALCVPSRSNATVGALWGCRKYAPVALKGLNTFN